MSRHERRAEIAAFRKEIAGADLITSLVPANTTPDDAGLRSALKRWAAGVMARRPDVYFLRVGVCRFQIVAAGWLFVCH